MHKVMDGFSTDSKSHIRTSDGDPRTGTLHQIWVTAVDTTCSVNEVLITTVSLPRFVNAVIQETSTDKWLMSLSFGHLSLTSVVVSSNLSCDYK